VVHSSLLRLDPILQNGVWPKSATIALWTSCIVHPEHISDGEEKIHLFLKDVCWQTPSSFAMDHS